MKYTSTMIVVKDIEKSKRFYRDVLGMEITADFGASVTLDNAVALQTLDTWKAFIGKDQIAFCSNCAELYFEEDNIESFCSRLNKFDICYVHEMVEHSWGQRAVRFYDPDKHIVEVAESLNAVCKRFFSSGMTAKQIAKRMDVPEEFVAECLSNLSRG